MIHARSDYNRIQDPNHKIPIGEPVILLRAQDKFAAEALRHYAVLVAESGGSRDNVQQLLNHAKLMDAWETKKQPDAPED